MLTPPAGDESYLFKAVEDLAIKQLVPQTGIEALDVAVFPRAAGFDVEGDDTQAAHTR